MSVLDRFDEPWSTLTAPAYALAGIGIAFSSGWANEALVLLLALLALSAGTWRLHASATLGQGQDLDHAGMHATFGALAALAMGAPWWLALAVAAGGALYLELRRDVPIEDAMGAYLVVIAVAGITAGAWVPLAVGFALLGGGYVLWREPGDLRHAGWHLATAAGIVALYHLGA